MIGKRPHRIAALLGALVLSAVAVVLPGTPAQAVYISQGTFQIKASDQETCFAVVDNRRDNGALVQLAACNSTAANQRWRIYQLDPNVRVYQINAYDGEWPLNKCLDLPESNTNVTIYGCHGGSQQRFDLSGFIGPDQRQIKRYGANDCIGAPREITRQHALNHKFDCNNTGARIFFKLIQLA